MLEKIIYPSRSLLLIGWKLVIRIKWATKVATSAVYMCEVPAKIWHHSDWISTFFFPPWFPFTSVQCQWQNFPVALMQLYDSENQSPQQVKATSASASCPHHAPFCNSRPCEAVKSTLFQYGESDCNPGVHISVQRQRNAHQTERLREVFLNLSKPFCHSHWHLVLAQLWWLQGGRSAWVMRPKNTMVRSFSPTRCGSHILYKDSLCWAPKAPDFSLSLSFLPL